MEEATPLLAIYVFFFGPTIVVGGVMKQIKEFSANSRLNDISVLIHLSFLEDLIQSSNKKTDEMNINVQIPSRKEKYK